MQSESSGDIPIIGNVMTGTKGYAKYDAIGPDKRHGMVYVYWDNPWFGNTQRRFATNADDVVPHCDNNTPPNSSAFSEDESLDFSLVPVAYRHSDGGGTITSAGDLAAAFAAGPVVGPLTLFGLEGIVKDPEWEYELRDVAPSFAPTQPRSYKLMTEAEPEDWVGDWRKDEIEVSITHQSANQLTGAISLDGSTPPTLVNFTIGPESALVGRLIATDSAPVSVSQSDHLIIREAAHRLVAERKSPADQAFLANRFEQIATAVHDEQQPSTPITPHIFNRIGPEIAQILVDSQATVHVGGFVLSLYGIFVSESRVSKILHLQRVVDGTPNIDVMLPEHFDIR